MKVKLYYFIGICWPSLLSILPILQNSIVFSQPILQKYYSLNKPGKNIVPKWEVESIDTHPLLNSLFDSILPYYELHGNQLPDNIYCVRYRL